MQQKYIQHEIWYNILIYILNITTFLHQEIISSCTSRRRTILKEKQKSEKSLRLWVGKIIVIAANILVPCYYFVIIKTNCCFIYLENNVEIFVICCVY